MAPKSRKIKSRSWVRDTVDLSDPTIWRHMQKGDFPQSVELWPGSNRIGWYEDEILDWVNTRKRVQDGV